MAGIGSRVGCWTKHSTNILAPQNINYNLNPINSAGPCSLNVTFLSSAPSPPPNQILLSPHSPMPFLIEPGCLHSILTSRIFPRRFPSSIYLFLLFSSYFPHSFPEELPRVPSSTSSTYFSLEFLEEVHIPSLRPWHYFNYDLHLSLSTLIAQFSQRTIPLPPGFYSIGPDDFYLDEIRTVISSQNLRTIISVFLPHIPFPYVVTVLFFLATIHETND